MLNVDLGNKFKIYSIVLLVTSVLYAGISYIIPEIAAFHLLQNVHQCVNDKQAKAVFRPVTLDGVFTFFNVCLEPLPTHSIVNMHSVSFSVTQRIVIYDRNQWRLGKQKLRIAGPPGHPYNYYDVYFTKKSLSLSNKTLSDSVAYFVSPRCPGNLHHFFQEEYMPLYSVIRLTNRLHPGSENLVIHNTPKTDRDPYCRNPNTYKEIFRTLFTNGFHDVFYNVPNNTCFRNAVFGSRIEEKNSRDIVRHVIDQYNLSNTCTKKAEFITLVFRKQRRIINMEDLRRWVLKRGFERDFVRVVDFDNIPIRKQMELACTSQVMIGINGAALQWSIFMPEKSHMVEMSWPSRSWDFFYPPYIPKFGIFYHSAELKDVRVNWTSFEFRMLDGAKVGEKERQRMLKSPPFGLWKWADVFIHEDEVNETMLVISNSILNSSYLHAVV